MKWPVLCLLYFATVFKCAFGQTAAGNEAIIGCFSAIVANDRESFISHHCSKPALKEFLKAKVGIIQPSKEQDQRLEYLVEIAFPDYVKNAGNSYDVIQKNTAKVNWNEVHLDSIAYTSQDSLKGCIFFRQSDRSAFYKMNFEITYLSGPHCLIKHFYAPYLYIGPKNRMITASIKKQYLDSCEKRKVWANQFLFKDDCPRCTCEKQYISETEQQNGVKLIKQYILEATPPVTEAIPKSKAKK